MRTQKIAEDFFMFQGGIGLRQMPPSYCNTYLLRDENTLILYDTSAFEDIRSEMLKIIKKYEDICNKFYLINGHSDLDHIGNNDVIDDVKIKEKHFLIHESGLPRLAQSARFRAVSRTMQEIAEPLKDSEKETITIGNVDLQGPTGMETRKYLPNSRWRPCKRAFMPIRQEKKSLTGRGLDRGVQPNVLI